MAPKRARTYEASSTYHSEKFSTQTQETIFNHYYDESKNLDSRYLDDKTFKHCNFVHTFADADIKNFVFKSPQEIYPTLVKMIYANFKYAYGTLISKVKNV